MSAPSIATIDGIAVELGADDTVLAAARRAGVAIPTLCHVEGLAPDGGCRLCLVEVEGERTLQAACHARIAPGAVVRTRTARLVELRRGILRLVVEALPRGARIEPASELGALLAAHGVHADPAIDAVSEIDRSHAWIRFDRALCVACRRCVHACAEIQGRSVFGVEARGAATRVVFGPSERFADSACTACGACVDLCPTSALGDRDSARPAEARVGTVCGYCGVGCRVDVGVAEGRVSSIRGVRDAAVNRGHLCVKGRFAHGWQSSTERLTTPLVREGSAWRPIGWEEAIELAARRLAEVRDRRGAGAIGLLTSSRSTNEAAYLLQRTFRAALGTNHVDCCARVCHAPTAVALRAATGIGAASAAFEDVEHARCIVVAGANATEAHPVIGARILAAARRGARLVVIDPRRIELADAAYVFVQPRPGANVVLLGAIARVLLDERLVDERFLAERVDGLAELERALATTSIDDAARACGVDVESIRAAARAIGSARPALFVHGLGLTELVEGTDAVAAFANLALLTGSFGLPGAGMLPLRGQNNVQGNADMGASPDQLVGYQPVRDDDARARLEALWGRRVPSEPGFTLPEMLAGARKKELGALWIQGEDVARSDPDETRVLEALDALEFLVVQELFLTETARRAHLVLPAAGALEQDGTFTNGERRVQRVRAAVAPPGGARPDWIVARDLSRALGVDAPFETPADVMDEIARAAPALFGGMSAARLDGDGLQWPCPDAAHPGTVRLFTDRFATRRARLAVAAPTVDPEARDASFPYQLVTGRVLEQYNAGSMTRRDEPGASFEDRLEMHPDDAAREHVADGERVTLASRHGRCVLRARVADRVLPGTLFASFHDPDAHVNRVVGPSLDPRSRCPQYKSTAVRVERT